MKKQINEKEGKSERKRHRKKGEYNWISKNRSMSYLTQIKINVKKKPNVLEDNANKWLAKIENCVGTKWSCQ